MNNKKPQNIDEYKEWLKKKKIEISDKTEQYYESVNSKIKKDFKESEFWTQLTESLKEFDSKYHLETGYVLLAPEFKPKLDTKTFDSFLLKTFRKNILENKNWPKEPESGWILPDNWYSRINDIVRTLFIVKYLDGIEFIVDQIKTICEQQSLSCRVYLKAKEEGYYAAHLYINQEFEIPRVNWDTEKVKVDIEIQITTQLQEVIRKLLHKYYEERRKKAKKTNEKWQWNYKSNEFSTNYLGHILHYIEGMIMEIREKQKEEIT